MADLEQSLAELESVKQAFKSNITSKGVSTSNVEFRNMPALMNQMEKILPSQTKTVNPTTSEQSVSADSGYKLVGVKVNAVKPSDYYKPEEIANVTPTTSDQEINPTNGAVFSKINVSAVTSDIDSNIQEENIKEGVTILGVVGTMKEVGGSPKFAELVDGSITTIEESDLSDVTSIRDDVFANLEITSVEIPSNVTSIGDSAFANNEISSLTLNEGLQTIGASAFANNPITTLTIPSTVTSIGISAFGGTQITELDMSNVHTPPIVDSTSFPSTLTAIHVAYGDYDAYLSAWSDYADKIVRGLAIPSTITVTVNNYLGEMVSGASVTISGNGQTYTGTTDMVGVFSQGDLQPATYTISVADLEGFKTPENQEVVVEEGTQNSVVFTYLEKPQGVEFDRVFGNNSPDVISAVSNEIEANNFTEEQIEEIYGWKVGDTKTFTISGVSKDLRIIDFLHDDKADGLGKAGITLDMTTRLPTNYRLDDYAGTYRGWKECSLRLNDLPTIKETIPQEWRNVIKNVNKYSSSPYSSVYTTIDDLFILSAIEVGGGNAAQLAVKGSSEGSQYKYYVSNSLNKGSMAWSLRSCSTNGNTYRMVVSSSGEVKALSGQVNKTLSVTVAFCV